MKKIVVICGPTVVGKTQLALKLAQQLQGEIISADSQQVYRGMDIGTAKPTQEERKLVPNHLLDVVDPSEVFHAGRFVELADAAIEDILSRGRSPFVVGGTGLYLKALLHGLCEAPLRDDRLREQLLSELEIHGAITLHKRLQTLDPDTAHQIHPHHKHRLLRALEICELTGKGPSEFFRKHQFHEQRYDALLIGLTIDRKELHARIDERVDRMLEQGWIDEVKMLIEKYGSEVSFQAVGYRELADFFRNRSWKRVLPSAVFRPSRLARETLPEAPPTSPELWSSERRLPEELIASIKQQTRQYAKRQMTWFRKMPSIVWYDACVDFDILHSQVENFLKPRSP